MREIVGYCAIELSDRGVGRTFRVFVVTDWSKGTDDAGVLYQQVLEDLRAVGATESWMREYASDTRLIAFFEDRGFHIEEPYERGGARLVVLRRAL